MKQLLVAICVLCAGSVKAQKIDSIFFNLYTDSLKKGVHNYINVDAKLTNGSFFPLTSSEIELSSSAGRWEGNSLIIDSSYNKDSVVITTFLKDRPQLKKCITIYIKKADTDPDLLSEKELLEGWRKESKKRKNRQ